MDDSPTNTENPGFLLMRILFKLNGPPKNEEVHMLPTKGVVAAFLSDKWSREVGPALYNFRLSKFCDLAATHISPLPLAWMAVIGDTGYVFESYDDGPWYNALDAAVEHVFDNLSEDDGLTPAITFFRS
jgi:hypothetical protein